MNNKTKKYPYLPQLLIALSTLSLCGLRRSLCVCVCVCDCVSVTDICYRNLLQGFCYMNFVTDICYMNLLQRFCYVNCYRDFVTWICRKNQYLLKCNSLAIIVVHSQWHSPNKSSYMFIESYFTTN